MSNNTKMPNSSDRTAKHSKVVVPKKWTESSIPSQVGRVALVTGANGGLGLVVARELARSGAHIVLACRDATKGWAAAALLSRQVPEASVEVQALDLADLRSIRSFAATFGDGHERLDMLINNAGVMAPPYRTTADGFELQIGTNHLGHYALTGLLLPLLLAADQARIVTVSSTLHAYGKINFDDLHLRDGYHRYTAYGRSKLANLLFAFELDRRARAAGTDLVSVAAHPGYAATNLQTAGIGFAPLRTITAASNRLMATSPRMGALPTLCAATLPGLPGGAFIGPSRLGGYRGYPGLAEAKRKAYDQEVAKRLWEVSATETAVRFAFPQRSRKV